MHRTEHSGNQEFGPLTPPSGKGKEEEDLILYQCSRILRLSTNIHTGGCTRYNVLGPLIPTVASL